VFPKILLRILQVGRTILKLASQNGNIEIAELMVAARCDINMTDNVRVCDIEKMSYNTN